MRYLLGLVLVVFLLSLLTGVTQISPEERAVVRRFGKVLAKPGPGLYIGLPWGIDQVERVRVERVRRVTVGRQPDVTEDEAAPAGQLVAGDNNLIDFQIEISYAVNDDDLERFVLQADRTDALVARAAEASLVAWVATKDVDSLVSGNRAALEEWVREETAEWLVPYELGIRIELVTISYLRPPLQVKDAFARVDRAETERETVLNIAKREKNDRLEKAEAKAKQIRREAATYANDQRLRAQAEADSFERRLAVHQRLIKEDPYYLNAQWWDETAQLFARLRQTGRIDLLDHHLGKDGLDITQMPLLPLRKRGQTP
jgi:membrane protease subunit HflK